MQVKYRENTMVILEMVSIYQIPLYRGGQNDRLDCIHNFRGCYFSSDEIIGTI